MSNKDAFGQRGDAAKILELAKEQVAGQAMSKETLEKARKRLTEEATVDHTAEAAGFTEAIIAWLNKEWNEQEFTPEQRIFSIALATINLRQHFPADKGGTQFFDTVCREAQIYFAANKG